MRERPPPMSEEGELIECEFVIPINSLCLFLQIGHTWEQEDERVKVCKVCDAEWWSDPTLTKEEREEAE